MRVQPLALESPGRAGALSEAPAAPPWHSLPSALENAVEASAIHEPGTGPGTSLTLQCLHLSEFRESLLSPLCFGLWGFVFFLFYFIYF